VRALENAALSSAKKRIAALEAVLDTSRRAIQLFKEKTRQKVAVQPVNRVPAERSIRRTKLTGLITQTPIESRGIDGARRIHSQLTLGHGVRLL
jgi:hypothetical protein